VHVLAEPTRRRIFDALRARRGPMTRDDVAAELGISRNLAAFHLDQLMEAGLADVSFARPPGRSGPGAGRPAKQYAARTCELALTVPARRYDLAARILARGVASGGKGQDAKAATLEAAHDEGSRVGGLRRPSGRPLSRKQTMSCAADALGDLGFEPGPEGSSLRMRNCPFHAVVDVAPDIVCGLNQAFIGGLLEGLGGHPSVQAVLDPAAPDCCVRVGAD
jgi:predicted ArsR family transcriptional regulator